MKQSEQQNNKNTSKTINTYDQYKESLKQLERHKLQREMLDRILQMDSNGFKKVVDKFGIEQKLKPITNSFFFRQERPFTQEEIAYQSQIAQDYKQEKEQYERQYFVRPNSPIYNYPLRDINFMREIYDKKISPEVKSQIKQRTAWLQQEEKKAMTPVGFFGVLFLGTLRYKWLRLTTKHSQRVGLLFFLGQYYSIKVQNTAQQKYNSILRHHQQFQKLIKMYEEQNQIV